MNRYGYLTRHFLGTALLTMLALFANFADASEQEIFPDVRWFSHASNVGQPSLEAAVADYNSYRASMGYPPISNPQPCPEARVYNGLAIGYCWVEPDSNGNPQLVGHIGPRWECPEEAPTSVVKELPPPLHYRLYCKAPQARQPSPPESCRDTCVGNPIQANTQIKIQRDFDLGTGVLRFGRVYTSSTGEWRHSFSTRAWNLELNSSSDLPSNPSPGCFWATVSINVPKQRVCLPYISNSDLGRTGAADWLVVREDGRTVGFSSVTQRSIDAATHETAHAVLNGGVFEGLVIYNGRDTLEFFDRQGRLTRRSQLNGGGALLTYLTPTGQKYPTSAPDCVGLSTGPGTAGRPSCVTDLVTGRQLQLGYTNGGLTSVTDPSGHSVNYQYNGPSSSGSYPGFDALTSVTYSDLTQRTYHYNESSLTSGANLPQALTGITDETNSRYSRFGYDASRRAISTTHTNGVGSYTINPTQLSVTDALGRQSIFTSKIVTKTASDGATASRVVLPDSWQIRLPGGGAATEMFFYDAAGNVTVHTDYRGIRTRYEYDLTRNYETLRAEAYGWGKERRISTAWHPRWHLPAVVAEPKRMTWSIYNGQADPTNGNAITTCAPSNALLNGHPIAVLCKRVQQATTDATGQSGLNATLVGPQRSWTYAYNANGQTLTVDGPRTDVNDTTSYTYYAADDTQIPQRYRKGDLHTASNAAGHVTTYSEYSANGQPITIIDPNGVTTTLTYDLRYRLTSRTMGLEQTTFAYWPTGLLKKTTLPDGTYLEYTYDEAHRLTDISDSEGNLIHYTLDAMGNRTKEEIFDSSSLLTRTTTKVFDVLDRIWKQIGAAGTTNVTTAYGYDSKGNPTSIIAPLGRDTTQVYDELERLSKVTDPLGGLTQYGYNGLDQLISVTDPKGLTTSYSYNGLGDLEQQVSPDTGMITNTYDSGGNLVTSTDSRSAVTTYTYDALNRVATASFAVGSTTDQTLAYTYDAGTYGKGRLTGVSDSSHSLSWTYDDRGRVLTAGQTVGSVSKTTSYTYANGLRQSMTTPSGQVITYGYTNAKITSISVNGAVLVSDVLHDPFGPVRQWTWSDGSLSVRTFDQDGKITQIDSGGLKTYSYDDAFRITGITDTTNSALSWTYGYDDLDRLTSASKSGAALGYTYDANGNRLTETGSNPSTFTIAANSNRLTSTSGTLARTYGYNNAGNTTSFTGITFTYNNGGRMQSSTKNGVTTNYLYNALGQLIKKGSSTLYYYDEAGHIIGIYDSSGALTEEIVWLGDTPLASLRPKAGGGIDIYNIHADHLNTPRLITDSVSTAVRWRWDAGPFGTGTVNNNPSGAGVLEFNLRFPGQIVMAEMGLYYNYYRDYDPATGRYIQSDPIGLGGGLNTYAYVSGRPVSSTDPLGLAATLTPFDPKANMWCCQGGVMKLCMNDPDNSLYKCQIIHESMRVHEDRHYKDFGNAVPKICAGTTRNYGVGFQTRQQADISELNAFNDQWEWLQRRRKQACMTPECEAEIEWFSNWILYTAIPSVTNGTYNRP